MCAFICDSVVLGGFSDVVHTCLCSRCSCCYLIWRSGVFTRTPSPMWGRLYLPMFLFRVGLLTLMYMDSLIVLVKPCPSCLLS